MTILQELKQYSEDCISDINLSCQKHKWACQRFLNDISNQNSQDFPYYWNEEEAEKIVKWFTYLRHSKGVLPKQPIHLTSWQKFCLCQIYGWRHYQTGYKRFTKSFIEVGRKNAKSQMEAGVVLYEIATQSTKNNEVYEAYCAGVKRDQSKIIFDECILMLKGSPLKTKFKITRDRITHIKTGSYLKALCKEDGKKGDGTNPAILILDEYHQHPTTEFYDLGYGANSKESLLMIITTAGKDLTYPAYTQEYKYCSGLLNPDIDSNNDNYFIDICELEEHDNIYNESLWIKANPIRMTYPEGINKIREACKIAKEIPEKAPEFMTKCLNIWVQAKENGYMDMSKWKACEVKKIPYDLKGKDVYVGFDMSAKIDLTSIAFIIPIMDNSIPKYICFSHSFIPNKQKLQERIIKDKQPYDAWKQKKFLSVTNTDIVDQQQVFEYVEKTCKDNGWNIHMLCFDPANASKMMMDASNDGYNVIEVFQSHKSLNESTAGFREQVYSGNVLYLYNPLLNYAMSNAVIKPNNGLIKIDKDANTKRVDPVDAMLCAYKLAYYHEFEVVLPEITEGYLKSIGW